MSGAQPADLPVLEVWWRHFVAAGRLPEDVACVQQRLVRAVGRGELPSGPVFLKAMTFPRAKDRLRYLARALPAAHEAALLRAVAAAGIRCPEVVAVRTARWAGLPFRSLLVLRALPVAERGEPAVPRLRDAAAIAARLLEAGIEHGDLHGGNFVRLADGELAVLDLQSARLRGRVCGSASARVAAAARLLREHLGGPAAAAEPLLQAGLLRDAGQFAEAVRLAEEQQRRFQRGRVLRCLQESTEFGRRWHWCGVEHHRRGGLPRGRWLPPDPRALRCWLGQRALHLFEARAPVFAALRRRWWWRSGMGALYAPHACSEDRIEAELSAAAAGYERHCAVIHP
ncbi:MAG: hypothetical protein FJ265_10330 [Planctomycetes bacterium]|nr:hypothetical protein [Planctomycetota bacterium]